MGTSTGQAAMPGDFGGIRPVGIKVVVEVHALDDAAHLMMDTSADHIQGGLKQVVDRYLADQISGQWACAVKASRVVG